jgi:DNA-binding transcriptional MerR regulator
MTYAINQLAKLAGVSVRTLHHYDEIGLLRPHRSQKNGYRAYGEDELLKLQQILFFRELEFPLADIRRILASPDFDLRRALADQRALIELKKKRLTGLLKTIDKTIQKITHEKRMEDKELYDAFADKDAQRYAEEAKQRWGHTEAYKQSAERVKKMTKADMAKVKADADALMKEIAAVADQDPASAKVQALITRHYDALRTFYEPSIAMYRGLADLYVADPRFTAYYEAYRPGLALFMQKAMHAFCDKNG